jgi:hypothetical protein
MLLSSETIIDPEALERLRLPRLQLSAQGEPARDAREPEDEAARISQALRQTRGNVEGGAAPGGEPQSRALSHAALWHRTTAGGTETLISLPPITRGHASFALSLAGEGSEGKDCPS